MCHLARLGALFLILMEDRQYPILQQPETQGEGKNGLDTTALALTDA